MANVKIDIASEFKGKPAFDKAGKSVSQLDKTVNKLANKFVALFATQKIVAFGKASAQAFMEDEKAANQLANAVKNLGLNFANPIIATYIENLSKLSGVADDQLRPSFQALLLQTKDLTKSQELLNLAIDVSRGSGQSLETVSNDLALAYVGQTKGLKKYYLGLTQAELKTMSFADVQKRLTDQFKGSSTAYLKTYAGQMERLTTASGEAKETIGKGLLDSLTLLGKDKSVENLADSMKAFSDNIANAIYGIASLTSKLKELGTATPSWLKNLASSFFNSQPIGALARGYNALTKYGETQRNKTLENPSVQMFKTDMANLAIAINKNKPVVENTKAVKKLTDKFDVKKANIAAALANPNISADTRKRLLSLQAIENGNVAAANKYGGMVKPNASMASPTATVVNVYPQGNVLTEQDLATSIIERMRRMNVTKFGNMVNE